MMVLLGIVSGIAFVAFIFGLIAVFTTVLEHLRLRREEKGRVELALRRANAEALALVVKAEMAAKYKFPPESVESGDYRVMAEVWSNYIPAKRLPNEFIGYACPRCSTPDNVVLMFAGETGNDTEYNTVWEDKREVREDVCACGLHMRIVSDYNRFSYSSATIFELNDGVDTQKQLCYTEDTEEDKTE